MAASASSITKVQQVYIAYFGRPGDPGGVTFWAEELDKNGGDISAIMVLFGKSDEYLNNIGAGDISSQVNSLYLQMFGRSAIQSDLDFWVGEINAGNRGLGDVAIAMAESALGDDATTLTNRIEVAEDFTTKVTATGAVFDGDTNIADAKAIIASVTSSSASVTAGKTSNDSYMTAHLDTISLTTGVDALTGTSGDDTFSGDAETNPTTGAIQDTLQSTDTMDGGAGTDSFSGQLGSAGTTTTVATEVKGIETFSLKSLFASTFNMASTTGVTTLINSKSTAQLDFTNSDSLVNFTVDKTKSSTSIGFTSAATQGTSDTFQLTLSGADGGTTQLVEVQSSNSIETVSITSSGSANDITLGGNTLGAKTGDAIAGTTTLNLSGNKNLTLDPTSLTALTSVDGSSATGNLTVDLTAVTTNLTINGGSGDDHFSVTSISSSSSYNGGSGTDKISTTLGADVTTAPTLTSIEKLQVTATGDFSVDLDKATSLTDIIVEGNNTNTTTAKNLAASATNVTFNGSGTTTTQTIAALHYELKDATGTNDSVTVNVTNVNSSGNGVTKATDATTVVDDFTANDVEKITIKTANLAASSSPSSSNIFSGGVDFFAWSTPALTSLTLESDTFITFRDHLNTSSSLSTIDGSAAHGGVFINLNNQFGSSTSTADIQTGNGVDTIIGHHSVENTISSGAGNDKVYIHHSTKSNSIDLGAGNDEVYISGNTSGTVDTVTTGSGSDTVVVSYAYVPQAAQFTPKTIITDFTPGSGGDKIDFYETLDTSSGLPSDYVTEDYTSGPTAKVGGTTLSGFSQVAAGATVPSGTGMMVLADNIDMSGVSSDTSLKNALIELLTTTTANTFSDISTEVNPLDTTLYLAVDDGADAYVFFLTLKGGQTTFDSGDSSKMVVKLTGVSDVTTLTADNFVDFS